ncbi:SNF2-related protein [Gaetbulibacter sp. M235]|uniref:SNF2-related protein n=1 Tax=Gaetbulibacter sp. M235 TaxID=3126510 RepID=UPI00374F77F1
MEEKQLSFDFDVKYRPLNRWPLNEEFPLNIKDYQTVEEVVLEDLEYSKSFTVITGYTSLSYLIDTFGSIDYPNLKKIRIVLGFEPNSRGRKNYSSKSLDKEIKEYWLNQELSILQGGSIINLIEKIKNDEIVFKFKNRLHAKIYVSDRFATLGSSNFSNNGLKIQTEANIRISKNVDLNKYENIELIADNFFNQATSYDKIIDLLKELIQKVSWQEALARAISEVIEGDWLNDYKELFSKLEKTKLWSTQWNGLAQAMRILQENSNVLIADPTGSGKTKLCSAIILCLKHWLWESGRRFKDNSVIVCPPLVMKKWGREFRELSNNSNHQISMGILSSSETINKKEAIEDLRIANILAIDEAHNYLNTSTKRSISLRKNNADFKILITATPISKKVDDLLKLVELLDLDNLDDKSFKSYQELIQKPYLQQESNLETLKKFISKFTVRRTKREMNRLIDKSPESYINKLGLTCRFPEQNPRYYDTNETDEDKVIVESIGELSKELKGITYLTSLVAPSYEFSNAEKIQEYIDRRFFSAQGLCKYNIRKCLRSSNVALYEHIYGTERAKQQYKFKTSKNENKARVNSIEAIIEKNRLPIISKTFKDCKIPDWYQDKLKFIEACKKEVQIYKDIADLTLKLSGERELGKINLLADISKKHNKIVAFDSTVITLNYFEHLFKIFYPKQNVLVASGANKKDSERVLYKFELTSDDNMDTIALCSDKMAEGVDLQKASVTVLLDMPSVLRVVEQRLGRIDRMDSTHKKILTYWPNDSEIYSLKGDKRLVEINDLVENTIGSNIKIPDELNYKHFQKTDSIQDMVQELKEYSEKDGTWEGVHNSFQPIINLKEGKTAIIKESEYNQIRNTKATIKTRVSFLNSKNNWCFFALRGSETKSSRWYFIELNKRNNIYTEYPEVSEKLREYIVGVSERKEWEDEYLKKYINILKEKEIELLAPKKRRALIVAKNLLEKKIRGRKDDEVKKRVMRKLLKLFDSKFESVDFEAFAELWIGVLQPRLEERKERNNIKRKVFNLNSLIKGTASNYVNFTIDELSEILEKCPVSENINTKIASCIISIKG